MIAEQAVTATGAICGWVLATHPDGLVVLATFGPTDPAQPIGAIVQATGARGFALSADQPTALMPSPTDESNRGVGGYPGIPPSLLVAAGGTAIVEVAGKHNDGAFTFDDIETLSSFAQIAGAAVLDHEDASDDVQAPAAIAAELASLQSFDPGRYREIARVVEALLSSQR
jgi:hypothetical protein